MQNIQKLCLHCLICNFPLGLSSSLDHLGHCSGPAPKAATWNLLVPHATAGDDEGPKSEFSACKTCKEEFLQASSLVLVFRSKSPRIAPYPAKLVDAIPLVVMPPSGASCQCLSHHGLPLHTFLTLLYTLLSLDISSNYVHILLP